MYKFSKLFIKNLLFAILFILLIGLAALFLMKNHIATENTKHQQTIQMVSKQLASLSNDTKQIAIALAATLTKSYEYQSLQIKYKQNSYSSLNNKQIFWLNPLLTKPKNILLNSPQLQLQYQLDFSILFNFVIQLFMGIILLSFVFALISAKLNYNLQSTIFRIISKQIAHELAQINDPDFITKLDNQGKALDIPALKHGIDEIRSLMVSQLKNTANLELKAHVDTLTGVENRNRFVQFFENTIVKESRVNFGVLLITRCTELQTINKVEGYNSGDKYIVNVANIIKNAISTNPTYKVFRLNSSDFATIIPNEKLKSAEKLATELTLQFNQYQQKSELESVAFSGLVSFDKSKPLGELLALADTGVSVAQTQKTNSWYAQTETSILASNSNNLGSQNWRDEIENVIDNKSVKLLLQPIQPSGRNSRVYGEILARFINSTGDMLPTATFFAMAEKLDQIVEVDKLIIDTAIEEITSKNMLESSYGINISPRSINDEHFIIWLERKLLREPAAAPRLVFEVSEFGLQQNIKTAKRVVDMLHRVGSRITVERFGVGLTSFKFFRDLTPDFIKMDSSYTRDIDDDKNNQYFLRLMVDLAHRLSINVLAESVESQEEKHTLEKLFIDGCQGYYVGKPSPL
jgi:diguanylate cyclase (GGDEF)-like protein